MIKLESRLDSSDFFEKYLDGYFLTIDDLADLVRDFQVDNFDGFVSNDQSYIEEWLKKHERIVKNDKIPELLKDWCKLINIQKAKKDNWSEIPQLPRYRFKNLQMIIDNEIPETGEMSITVKCDEWKIID